MMVASIQEVETVEGARTLLGTMEPDSRVDMHCWEVPDLVYA